MARKNNKNDMSITEQLEVVKDSICIGYCKYYEAAHDNAVTSVYKNEKEASNWLWATHCKCCPVREI